MYKDKSKKVKYTRFKNKQYGSSNFLTALSKKLVRPAGFKRIRTSTGSFKSFSRGARGKEFRFFGKFRSKSSKNIKNRLNYMNERVAGKTQKIEGYAAKLKDSKITAKNRINEYSERISGKQSRIAELEGRLGSLSKKEAKELRTVQSELRTLQNKQKSIISTHAKDTLKMEKKIAKAQTNLQKKLDTYGPKQKKYQALMQKKIYKSQKRLDKGFTKTCRNLAKKKKSAIGCLEAFETCKGKGHGLDIKAMTSCINLESEAMGLPVNLSQGEVTGTMTKLANKHFFRRFKRARHLREIARISKHGSQLQKAVNTSSKTLDYGKTLRTAEGDTFHIEELSKARTRQLSGQDIIPGSGIKDFSSPQSRQAISDSVSLKKSESIDKFTKEEFEKLIKSSTISPSAYRYQSSLLNKEMALKEREILGNTPLPKDIFFSPKEESMKYLKNKYPLAVKNTSPSRSYQRTYMSTNIN